MSEQMNYVGKALVIYIHVNYAVIMSIWLSTYRTLSLIGTNVLYQVILDRPYARRITEHMQIYIIIF